MLQSVHYELLDRLRFSKSGEERQQALQDLMVRELNGDFDDEDLTKLLKNDDSVFQSYAIGALGRLPKKTCISDLKILFQKSNNPIILVTLLDTFLAYASEKFVDVVLKKLKKPTKKLRFRKNATSSIDSAFDDEMIREQILVPSLKYFQIAGDK